MEFIPLTSPDIRDEDINAVVEVLKSGMLVQAQNVQDFEAGVATFTQTKNAIAVSNGTATLHLALVALGIGPGDEVIIPALSYVATANVVELVGATPVFVDVDTDTFNIEVAAIEAKITSKTKAIMPVHEFGLACDIEAVMKLAEKHGLPVIEDAACALGATQNGKHTGSFGIFGSFSFHPRKAVSSGEGGILTTSDDALAAKVRILRNHGVEMQHGKMEFVAAGFNYRMTDFQAALVNSQLKRLLKIIDYKNELAEVYFNEINHSGIKLPVVPADRNHTWQTFHVVLDSDFDRDKVITELREKGIGTNYGAQCIPAQQYYLKKYGLDSAKEFPNALRAFKSGLAIPIYEKLQKEQIRQIASVLNKLTR
ncbi:DegT/DnrJ/EryC1/StrS family aminotransferase [Adhaeribacter soli]|uniref:DegT/DnrJ/EryC1/StrS family aminotransferase n=1 Tax=Adhaeribacter soli TaxID=2607655 RepID=A0A5N1IM23_9BACT|nr:DegT/DnrJ/EryC1/StrS family aminotransferase [Adhaeribacter soli]KAA9327408.1 DegT/DnrJ/EryC1/StrS family aminotransferase [Adhaeribacter soli]